MTTDKIPIGKLLSAQGYNGHGIINNYLEIRLKDGVRKEVNVGDIITLDMIEPYESIAVRKVAEYMNENLYPEVMPDRGWFIDHAKKIVALVHEAEDADE